MLVLLGAFSLAPARAAVRILAVTFFPDSITIELTLNSNLGRGGWLGTQVDSCKSGRESGGRERLERIAP